MDGLSRAAQGLAASLPPAYLRKLFHKPIFIVSAPRSGSTFLFEQLSRVPGFWSIGGESHHVFRLFPGLRAENTRMDSGCLGEKHADRETRKLMKAVFLCLLQDCQGNRFMDIAPGRRPANVLFLEKTPRNALNIPFLLKVFPDARFIYLHRDPRENIASIIEAWKEGLQTGRFVTFADLPGWDRPAWCLLLPPGWRGMKGRSLAEIAAFQWSECNRIVINELQRLHQSRWTSISYRALVENPAGELGCLCRFAGLPPGTAIPGKQGNLPLSSTTLTPPHPDKWRRHETEINDLLPSLAEVTGLINRFCPGAQTPA